MLIRPEQMQVFQREALRAFENDMVRHLYQFSPTHCTGIGEENVRRVITLGMQRAATSGFTNRGPVRFYLELMFLFGSYFDTDPQLPPWATALLHDGTSDDQLARASDLHARTLEYRQAVVGPGNVYARTAVQNFRVVAAQPLPFTEDTLVSGLLATLHQLYPERCAYIGQEPLEALINVGRSMAVQQDLTTIRGIALCVLLMFQLGHGCFDDPLYPWVSRTLQDMPDAEASQRAQRLERRALAYLELIIRRLEQE
jgi:hypothetical protein